MTNTVLSFAIDAVSMRVAIGALAAGGWLRHEVGMRHGT